MQLKDFVAETLKELIDGIEEAQAFAKQKKAMVNPILLLNNPTQVQTPIFSYSGEDGSYYAQIIDFDIAVSTANDLEGEVDGGINVISVVLNAGVKSKAGTKDSTSEINRVRFSIPVIFPLQENVLPKRKPTPPPENPLARSKWGN